MPQITKLGRVMVPVSDQDGAIKFYPATLRFSLVADVPFGENDRWVEVVPTGGGAALALVRRCCFSSGTTTGTTS